ncbi:glycosyltransferase family 4 protein [Falsirhodobacter algicola]|uniref:Glycosyltransferase n=1 Tax=Falsirhodobacter algicola TaxID=2692330 RepID=A0A8J8SKX0_9RHOB|nr:glycosyltransferase family 4 protein [Falsirhodobacter algicola]QUS35876.1 glycosyltransferase [Falsirhodobacter algicola]
MKILFVHQNFPAQFVHLAPALRRRGHDVRALTDSTNQRTSPVPSVMYRYTPETVDPAATRLGRTFTQVSDRGVTVARAARRMRNDGYVPDVIFGHSGWGETLFLKQVWPEARLLIYAEFYYKGEGTDIGFDPEFGTLTFESGLIAQSRAAHLAQSLVHAEAGVAPTHWQAGTFPPSLRRMVKVIHDGVNTSVMKPDPAARFELPDGRVLTPGDEVLTFVNRNLEPYRGYHVFMRALPEVMAARPDAQVLIVGGDGVSYGTAPPEGSWKERFLSEVQDRLDLSRVHFLGNIPYDRFRNLLQVSRAHAYLTYPFVLSWSMLEAMSVGALVVGSDTAPVREAITHGETGLLVDFFDVPAWSRTLTEALADPERFRPIRAAARQLVLERYDLDTLCLPQMIRFVEGLEG